MRPILTAAELRTFQVDQHGRDYSLSDDGYSDMEVAATEGWEPIAGWGADGWDLGDWPYVVISARRTIPCPYCGPGPCRGTALTPGGRDLERFADIHYARAVPDRGAYEMRQTVEGDSTVYRFASREDRDAAIDYLFLWYALGNLASRLAEDDPDWQAVYGDGNGRREGLDVGTLRVPERLRGPYRSTPRPVTS